VQHDDNAEPNRMLGWVALRFCVVHSVPPVAKSGAVLSSKRSLKGHRIEDYIAELISIDIGFTLMIHA
jgi:hypothetical protein